MSFFAEIAKKPWLDVPDEELVDGPMFPLPRSTVGFRFFIGIISFLFILSVGAYAERLSLGDWHAMPKPLTLWLNTLLLILSSLAMRRAARLSGGETEVLKSPLLVGTVFGVAFVIGQLVVWMELVSLGYSAAGNPANAFFYMVSGLHGVHVLGGLVVLSNLILKVWSGSGRARTWTMVRLCAAYWHFLLIVWLVLFVLLLFT